MVMNRSPVAVGISTGTFLVFFSPPETSVAAVTVSARGPTVVDFLLRGNHGAPIMWRFSKLLRSLTQEKE
jgi:hypothetical protein